MELITLERLIIKNVDDVQAPEVVELNELELCMIGGGVGEISPY